jgi:hypothetical protein
MLEAFKLSIPWTMNFAETQGLYARLDWLKSSATMYRHIPRCAAELDSVSGAKEMYPVSLQRCGLMEKR